MRRSYLNGQGDSADILRQDDAEAEQALRNRGAFYARIITTSKGDDAAAQPYHEPVRTKYFHRFGSVGVVDPTAKPPVNLGPRLTIGLNLGGAGAGV